MTMDYVAVGLSRLVAQFDNSPKFQGFLSSLCAPFNEIEALAESLISDRWIDSAYGAQLDGCGSIVREPRKGRNDEEYREAIKFRIFVNISTATPTTLIRALKILTKPEDSQYLESYPATTILFTDGHKVDKSTNEVMQDLAPAGISDIPLCVSYGAKPFRFSQAPVPDEFFIDNGENYLTVDGCDLQVSSSAASIGNSTLGGVYPSDLYVEGCLLDIGGGNTLAVYDPNSTGLIGEFHLTGVFQA